MIGVQSAQMNGGDGSVTVKWRARVKELTMAVGFAFQGSHTALQEVRVVMTAELAATARGVMVVNAPTSNIVSAAEHAIALLLATGGIDDEAEQAARRLDARIARAPCWRRPCPI